MSSAPTSVEHSSAQLQLGTVSFHAADQTDWTAATLNYPVTSGNAFWTQPRSAAEIDVGSTHISLDQSTELDIDTLDDRTMQATEAQGAVFLRIRAVADGDSYRIATPRGVAVFAQPGAYEVVAGDADRPTTVTVVEGAARIDSTNASLTLGAGQTGRIDGTSNFAASVVPAVRDPFVTARLAREQQLARAPQSSAPPVVAQMTGGYALERVGSWAPSPQYGRIWYPPVAASWVPYRDGHWGYVAPWGWTWIDDAPWGFAPFHYGRWVRDGARWGWIPAERAEQQRSRDMPVYAPALVTFLGVGIAVGGGGRDAPNRDAPNRDAPNRDAPNRDRGKQGSVGWIPLGPREVYVPPYHTSDRYEHAVNAHSGAPSANVANVTTAIDFVNRGATTMVPVAAMTASQPIATRAERVDARVLARARPEHAAPVRPTAATLGVTPAVARELNIAPVPAAAKAVPAPGPVLPPPAAVHARPVPAVAPAPGIVALPMAAALPVLRPPTLAAPAHPRVGGTAVRAHSAAPAVSPVPVAAPPGAAHVPTPVPSAVVPASAAHVAAPVVPPIAVVPPHLAPVSVPVSVPPPAVHAVPPTPVAPPHLAPPPAAPVVPPIAVVPVHPAPVSVPVPPPAVHVVPPTPVAPPHLAPPPAAPVVPPIAVVPVHPAPVSVPVSVPPPAVHVVPPTPVAPPHLAPPPAAPIAAPTPAPAGGHAGKPLEDRQKDGSKP